MTPTASRSRRQGFPLAVFIAILAFVILMSVILISLHSILEKGEEEDSFRAGYEPVMLPRLTDGTALPDGESASWEIFQPDFGLSLLMAERSLKAGDFARAEDILRSLLLFFPGSPTAERLLGSVFYLSGQYAEAERLYRTMLKRDPSDLVSLNNLAMTQGMQEKFADAIENMKKVLAGKPDSATADLNLAGLYSKSGNRPLARKHVESARKKLGGTIRGLTFEPGLKELLMESDLHDRIAPLPDLSDGASSPERKEPQP